MAGYVELNAAGYFGHEDYDPYSDYSDWNSVGLNGAARVTIPVADPMILQLDVWGSTWSGNHHYCDDGCGDWDYTGVMGGLGAHFAYQMNGTLVGLLVSVGGQSNDYWGDDTDGLWVTGAAEAVANMGNMRLYGQAGASKAIGGDDGDDGELDLFAQGALAFYIDPNLAVSVNLGMDHWSSENDDGSQNTVTFGARLEKHFEGTPVSAYLAYQGMAWDGEDNHSGWSGVSHAVLVGLRFAFGDSGDTLQDLNDSVGLVDMNHIYGDSPH
jgi:hypothetical protein